MCGWREGRGSRRNVVGALVLGCRDNAGWCWVGDVGSGLSDADVVWWTETLVPAERSDPPSVGAAFDASLRTARWVEPKHVVQVAFAEWSVDRRLRQPSLLGRRFDVAAFDVCCE